MAHTFSRRALLASSLASPLALRAAGQTVIDVATHFYDTSRPQGVPWPSPRENVLYKPTFPERYREAVRPVSDSGVSISGVVAIEASPWLEDNLWLLNLADRYPLIRAVVGNIPPGHPDFRPALDRFAKHPLWRGIRIGSQALSKSPSDLQFLAEKNLSLDVLVNQPAYEEVSKLAQALPDLKIILGHLPLDNSQGIRLCAAHRNVFAKVSAVIRPAHARAPKALMDELWDVFGPDRLMYASNWPTSDMIGPYPEVFHAVSEYLADKPAEVREKFFWRNAKAAYRIT